MATARCKDSPIGPSVLGCSDEDHHTTTHSASLTSEGKGKTRLEKQPSHRLVTVDNVLLRLLGTASALGFGHRSTPLISPQKPCPPEPTSPPAPPPQA